MGGKNLSFTGKITALVLLTAVVVGGVTFGSAYHFLSKGYDEQAEAEIAVTAKAVQANFSQLQERIRSLAVSYSHRPDVEEAVEKRDTAHLQSLGKQFMANDGIGFVTIGDPEGKVIARGHSDKTGDSLLARRT